MSELSLFLFGPPRLEQGGRPVEIRLRKALALLAYVAVTQQIYSRDALATMFWPENDQSSARGRLRRTLYQPNQILEKEMETEVLEVTPDRGQRFAADRFSGPAPGR